MFLKKKIEKPKNLDTHNPKEFESKWYPKWQEKLEIINKDVK